MGQPQRQLRTVGTPPDSGAHDQPADDTIERGPSAAHDAAPTQVLHRSATDMAASLYDRPGDAAPSAKSSVISSGDLTKASFTKITAGVIEFLDGLVANIQSLKREVLRSDQMVSHGMDRHVFVCDAAVEAGKSIADEIEAVKKLLPKELLAAPRE